jgi:glutamate-1-semialdehyde 2,1-aminomutase
LEALQKLKEDLAPLFPQSRRHLEWAETLIPGGRVRSRFAFPFPIWIDRGQGSRLWDIDGHEYIDGLCGHGPVLLGHGHPEVLAAVSERIARGLTFGATTTDEAEVAGRIVKHVPGAEEVIFLTGGTEATLAAVRLARAATGKQKVAKFAGGFHGLHDYFLQNAFGGVAGGDPANLSAEANGPGIPPVISELTVMLPYDDPRAFDRLRLEADEIACVIIELVQGVAGALPADREFVRELRAVCDECGVLLIVDEIITGFRFGLGGASALYQINGDLITLGKALTGGYPGSAVAGRSDIISFGQRDPLDGTTHTAPAPMSAPVMGSTYSASPPAMAAAKASLDVLIREEKTIYPKLFALGERLRAGLQQAMDEAGWGLVTGAGSMWGFHAVSEKPASIRDIGAGLLFDEDRQHAARALSALLLREGVLVSAPMHLGFISAAHSEDDIDQMIAAHRVALAEMKERGFID